MKRKTIATVSAFLLATSVLLPIGAGAMNIKVKKGDTLSNLARNYHTTVTEIQKANELKSTTIKMGQALVIPNQTKTTVTTPVSSIKIYTLELSRWGIFNNGTNPAATTKGINDALKWAHDNGYKEMYVPAGTYLISKGNSMDDASDTAAINMVSDMTLELDKNAVFQKETNGYEGYTIIYVGDTVKNATVEGGTLEGDRDTHDYSKKPGDTTAGTNEWGYGINIAGGENITINGMKIEKMTGDGITIGGTTKTGSYLTPPYLEAGALDDKGQPINTKGKIRTVGRTQTNFDNQVYQTVQTMDMWLPEGLNDNYYDIYFYTKDNKLISYQKGLKIYSDSVTIPSGADYYRAVFDADTTKNVSVNEMTIQNANHVLIENNDIGYNRRQGITAGGENVQIINNKIHHTSGTAPQSGIDIEPGFFPAKHQLIKGNTFLDNKIQMVLCYGSDVTIDGNYLEQTSAVSGGVGLHIHQAYGGPIDIKNNTFKGSGLTVYPDNATMENNTFTGSTVGLEGNDQIFKDATLKGSSLSVGDNSNQQVSNVNINQDGTKPGALYIWDKPVHLSNITIKANTDRSQNQGLIFGYGNNDSIYDNLVVQDDAHRGTVLPVGTYNNPVFNAGGIGINRAGKFILNHPTFKDQTNLLRVDPTYGLPDVTINNGDFELGGNVGYGAAIYVTGANSFNLLNSTINAKNNTYNTPLIKLGLYGYPKPTQIFGSTIQGNTINLKSGTNNAAIDTSNAGTNAPTYQIKNNVIANGKLVLKSNDQNTGNVLLKS